MTRFDEEPRLLHGGDYNPDQWLKRPDILADDVAMMPQAHVNTVTVGIFSWSALEVREGEFDFSWLDRVFDEQEKLGNRIILATPSGGRPQWLSENYPEVNRVDEFGRRHHHGFRHNHCYSSPVYRQKVALINLKLAERYGKRQALVMWHISNEFSGECYCELCQANWRKWVQKKYHTLEAVNDAWTTSFWGSRYSSWSQVVPPSPLGETKNHGMDLDWKRFNTDMTIDFYLNEIAPLKELTPDVPCTTNLMAEGHDQHDFIPLVGMNYAKFAQALDVVSWDSYPDWHNNFESLAETAMKSAYCHDQFYSLKQKPFLVMESTPSGVNWHQYNKTKRPGEHILTSFQQIAHGSDSTLYFQWRQSIGNSEKFHGAVVGHDNTTDNRVFQEVAEYGARLAKMSDVKGATKKSRIALLFDWESMWALNRGGGFGRPTRRYPQTLQDHYAVFWAHDLAVDILTPAQDFSGYDLVVAPMLYQMSPATMDKLTTYVKGGGTLVSSYFTGMVDDNDRLYGGGFPEKLQTLFGLKTKEIDTLYPDEHNALVFGGQEFATKDYSEVVATTTGATLATYEKEFYVDTPAVVKNTLGSGTAYYLAARTGRDFLTAFYGPLLEKLQLENDVVAESLPDVSVQSRSKAGKTYDFIMNFSNEQRLLTLKTSVENVETGEVLCGPVVLAPLEVLVVTH